METDKLNNIKKGLIIVLEGVDGSGKTTQRKILEEFLALPENIQRYGESIFLREPGSTEAGQDIRKVILDYKLDAKTEALLFYASRNELIINQILPAINEGKNVVIDRFEMSTFAYQIYGRERIDLKDFVKELSREIVPENFVDHYFFFDLDVHIAKEREAKRNEETTRFDAEGVDFFNRIRSGYKNELLNFPHTIIDASQSIEEVKEDFLNAILKIFDEKYGKNI
jgi:dTMP kinase